MRVVTSAPLVFALSLGALALAVNSIQASEPVRGEVDAWARDVALALGFDESEVAQVEDGRVLTKQLREEGEKELAVVLFALVPLSVDAAVDRFRAARFEADSTVLEWGSIHDPARPEDFEALRLPREELAKLAGGDVEDQFNFSPEELALLAERKQGLEAPAEREQAALAALREILLARVRAYQSAGLDGVAPYRHGDDLSDPAADLRTGLPSARGLIQREDPDFHAWVHGYPKQGRAGSHHFVWLVQTLNDRPAVVLAHRAESAGAKAHFSLQRDFYVGHTFDALQILSGIVPAGPDRIALFYTNVTFTEQVTGFGSGAAHGIGRRIMTGEIRAAFDALLDSL